MITLLFLDSCRLTTKLHVHSFNLHIFPLARIRHICICHREFYKKKQQDRSANLSLFVSSYKNFPSRIKTIKPEHACRDYSLNRRKASHLSISELRQVFYTDSANFRHSTTFFQFNFVTYIFMIYDFHETLIFL